LKAIDQNDRGIAYRGLDRYHCQRLCANKDQAPLE